MALSFLEASLSLASAARLPPEPEVIMIGRQTNLLTSEELGVLEGHYGLSLAGLDSTSLTWSEPFFQRLGASRVDALDYSDYEGATLIQDMNQPWPGGLPPRQYDMVFDGGSLEHVFNVPQALLNAMQIVRPGGHFLSVTPADGWLGHGFHQLQPEFFFRMLTPELGFTMMGCWMGEFGRAPSDTQMFRLKDPAQTGLRHIIPARRPLSMMICARKDAEIPLGTRSWPAQSNYSAVWHAPVGKSETAVSSQSLKRRLSHFLPITLRRKLQLLLAERRRRTEARRGWQEVQMLSID